MGTCEGWLLLTDMDGTLLSPEGDISQQNRDAIARFVAQGGLFGIATGRMPSSIVNRVCGLPINIPIIVCNGAGIYDMQTEELSATRFLALQTVYACIEDVAVFFPDVGILVFEVDHAAVLSEVHWLSELTAEERTRFVRKKLTEVGEDVFKLVFTAPAQRITELRKHLADHPVAQSVEMLLAADTCLELLPPHVSKGAALAVLRDQLGIAPDHVLAIGDYENDAEMLRVAGISAAPENAHPDILALADMVVAHHGEDAVADFLERVFWK